MNLPLSGRAETRPERVALKVFFSAHPGVPLILMGDDVMAKSPNSPAFTYRRKGVSVSVFENQSQEGNPYYKTSLQRIYKEGTEFKSTTSLSRDDLPVAQLLLGKAFEFILEAESKRGKEEEQG